MAANSNAQVKALVLEAFDALFNERDYTKAAKFWSKEYVQHSAHVPQGRDGLFNMVRASPDTLRYENSHVFVDGNYVMLHGRFSGTGQPRAWIAADVVRLEDGRLKEHWDVLQDEVTREESMSGLPMFGTSFPPSIDQHSSAPPLSIDQARQIVKPLYDAFNETSLKNVPALLATACNPDYRSYNTNEDWTSLSQVADVFAMLRSAIPDMQWTIEEIVVMGEQIVARVKVTGTPTGELWGVKPTGKSFNTMAIDLFTVKNGKLASAYHVEHWLGALGQIRA